MKTIVIDKLPYKTPLGEGFLRSEVMLDDADLNEYRSGKDINQIDYGLNGKEIERLSRTLALDFFEKNYRTVLFKEKSLTSKELKAIQEILDVKSNQFATILGLDKGSLSNILRENREMQHSTQILVMERLGLELSRPGSIKAMLEDSQGEIMVDQNAKAVIEKVRFSKPAA